MIAFISRKVWISELFQILADFKSNMHFFFSGKRELRDRCIGKNSPLTFSTLDMSDWMLRTKRLW